MLSRSIQHTRVSRRFKTWNLYLQPDSPEEANEAFGEFDSTSTALAAAQVEAWLEGKLLLVALGSHQNALLLNCFGFYVADFV